jgi:NAD-dependent oxidoreductase involved in siderophore biosynthesis
VVATWLVTAAWDFVCASALSIVAYHSTFSRLWQSVASAALGPRAFEMGARGVAAGLALHLLVALTWSALFVLAASRVRVLQRTLASPSGAILVAIVYGPVIWLVMSFVVIHLATGRLPALTFRWWVQVFAHVPFVTLPLVFTARRMLGLAGDSWNREHVAAAESAA